MLYYSIYIKNEEIKRRIESSYFKKKMNVKMVETKFKSIVDPFLNLVPFFAVPECVDISVLFCMLVSFFFPAFAYMFEHSLSSGILGSLLLSLRLSLKAL